MGFLDFLDKKYGGMPQANFSNRYHARTQTEQVPPAKVERRNVRDMTAEQLNAEQTLLSDLEEAKGAYCEIRSLQNTLATLGYVEEVDFDTFAVVIAKKDGEMPSVMYNTKFKLIVRPRGGNSIVFEGMICGSNKHIWKLDNLQRYFHTENRGYFRQPINTQAYVVCVNALFAPPTEELHLEQAHICRVMDISLKGVQIHADTECFQEGDLILIRDLLLFAKEQSYYSFLARVKRSVEAGESDYIYGCEFDRLSEKQQNLLCSDIFLLNRMDIESCRL